MVYILIGAAGLPVFANFHGGIASLTGMSGGYILAWPVMALLSGIRPGFQNRKLNLAVMLLLSLAGLMIVEFAGAFQWSRLAGDRSLMSIIIPKDVVITVLAVILGTQIRSPLVKAGYLV